MNRVGWVIPYFFGVLVSALALGSPGGDAPLLFAIAYPGALALSRTRESPLFGPWIAMVVSGALGLWWVAGDRSPSALFLSFPALLGVLAAWWFFRVAGRGDARVMPLVGLAILAWLVAFFSSGHGSANAMLHWFAAHGASDAESHAITLAFRKTVHFTFYGTVGWVAWRTVDGPRSERVRTALLAALALASFDELRQAGYTNRTGSAWDVLLDVVGAATFVGLSQWRHRRAR